MIKYLIELLHVSLKDGNDTHKQLKSLYCAAKRPKIPLSSAHLKQNTYSLPIPCKCMTIVEQVHTVRGGY